MGGQSSSDTPARLPAGDADLVDALVGTIALDEDSAVTRVFRTGGRSHAEAGAARVWVERREQQVLQRVADDGRGGADEGAGSGLRGLRDRVEALRGTFAVESPAGGGTLVSVRLPLRG